MEYAQFVRGICGRDFAPHRELEYLAEIGKHCARDAFGAAVGTKAS